MLEVSKNEVWGITPEVETELKKKLKNLDAFCSARNIPFFACAAIRNESGGTTKFCSEIRSPVSLGVQLNEDRIADYMKVTRGCVVMMPEILPEIDLMNEDEVFQ